MDTAPITTSSLPVLDRLITDHISSVVALWLHLAVFVILASLPPANQQRPGTPLPVDVELVLLPKAAPSQAATLSPSGGKRAPSQEETLVKPQDDARAAEETASLQARPDWRAAENWVPAAELRSALVLQDRRSAQARAALQTVTGRDRREQLCALEAMEQVGANSQGLRPDRLVPYALQATVQRGLELYAPAGALRSQGNWYELAYRCQLNKAGDRVMDFQFVLGPPIPGNLWDNLGLAAVH
ncbi:DUF930 domain-containing protein [Roseibium alexandrii]|uniref:DUF930 domain-containing protein n=1 Tax=Roseibium alexandrii (strain DSM 17067 / NCIMB 14079 / DFL-11) TaxID=244592 RepID=A0A5E8UWE2_ROSAD|nr:DUF930 domain-containing protein [Roseibium alexandrii]RMX61867.1 protein of unknown function (DUF930) [Roseibium alexandrii DFL-11]